MKLAILERSRNVFTAKTNGNHEEDENIWKIARGWPAGEGGRWDYVVSRIHLTHTHVHELGNASAHWTVPRARPGLPAVVVSENFGNKLTRGLGSERERERDGDLAAVRRWQ